MVNDPTLVGSPTDVRPRFVNHDRRDSLLLLLLPPFFIPLPSPWNRGIDVVTRSSRSRRGLERDPFFKIHQFIFFFFSLSLSPLFLSSFLSARVEKQCVSLKKNGIRLKDVYLIYIFREDVVAGVSIKERDCRNCSEECD